MKYVALLRAINVGGRNVVPMAELRAVLEGSGWSEPQTLLQSGNVVFSGPKRAPSTIETQLEAALSKRVGVTADFFVRTHEEWVALGKTNPFTAAAAEDPGHVVVLLLKGPARADGQRALRAAIAGYGGHEAIEIVGTHAFAVYPDGIGRSKLTAALIEKHLGTRVTARNWNTYGKLASL